MEKLLRPVELKNVSHERNKSRFQKKLKNFCFSVFGIFSFLYVSPLTAFSNTKIEKTKDFEKQVSISSINQYLNTDSVLILKKCLDSEELLPYLSKNADGNFTKISIMQYPVVFSTYINFSKFGEAVSFLSRQEIFSNKVESYFIFKVFSIDGNTAKVEFEYTNNSSVEKTVEIIATLEKSGSDWKINDLTFNHK